MSLLIPFRLARRRGANELARPKLIVSAWSRAARPFSTHQGSGVVSNQGSHPRLDIVHELVEDSAQPGSAEGRGLKAVALRGVHPGEVIFREKGTPSPQPSMHSIQVGICSHMRIYGEGRFIAHSFAPNCKVVVERGAAPSDSHFYPVIHVVASRPIAAGEAFSFNYCTTEWELAEPFTDCDSGQTCAGFVHLSEAEKLSALDQGLLPPHIMHLWLRDVHREMLARRSR